MFSKIIVVFPGQGSQIVGMGRDLFENHHVAREVFEELDDTLNQVEQKIISYLILLNVPNIFLLIIKVLIKNVVIGLSHASQVV